MSTSLGWYLRRIAAMSPPEILHRVGEQAKRRMLRHDAGRWDRLTVSSEPLKKLPIVLERLDAVRPEALDQAIHRAADAAMAGQFHALGVHWPELPSYKGDIWFLDPVTGKHWPGAETFCFDVEYRHNAELGDVKYVWELNRLQFLQPVAVLARRDPRAARFAVDTVLSWMDANPPFMGINWASGIELALRLVSIAFVVAGAGDQMTPDEHRRFGALVESHAFWLERFPSLYSSANNHRAAEGLGLVTAALLMPDAPRSTKRLAMGQAILRQLSRSLFHKDGIGAEQSPAYAAFALEIITLGALLLKETRPAFDAEDTSILASGASALTAMLDGKGRSPHIGDDDECCVIGTSLIDEPLYVASVASFACEIDGVAVAPADIAPGGDAGLRNVRRADAVAPADVANWRIRSFPDGGYTVIRDVFGSHRAQIVFDHGPLGFGSIAAHGHADALSIWLDVDDRPVLVDAGTYLYHSGGAWRDFFRSTAAHNTLEVAGLSQSIPAGAFNWRHKARAVGTRNDGGPQWHVEGRHDGYKSRLGVHHVRRLKRTDIGFSVEDWLDGSCPPLAAAIRFLVHPDVQVIQGKDGFDLSISERHMLSIIAPVGMSARIVRGEGDAVGPGWYSPSFGLKVPAPCVVFEGTMTCGSWVKTEFRFPGA